MNPTKHSTSNNAEKIKFPKTAAMFPTVTSTFKLVDLD